MLPQAIHDFSSQFAFEPLIENSGKLKAKKKFLICGKQRDIGCKSFSSARRMRAPNHIKRCFIKRFFTRRFDDYFFSCCP